MYPHGHPRQDRQHKSGVLFPQVQPEEGSVHGCRARYREPAIEALGQARKPLRVHSYCVPYGPEQSDQDGNLNGEWSEAAHGINPHILVELHRLLGPALGIVREPVPNGLDPRLHGLHLLGLTQLPPGQGKRKAADEHRQRDDGDSEIAEQQHVKQQQAIRQRPDDSLVP